MDLAKLLNSRPGKPCKRPAQAQASSSKPKALKRPAAAKRPAADDVAPEPLGFIVSMRCQG